MPKINAPLLAFNRGIISRNALARTDVERVRLSAEIMQNFMPTTQGSMYLRTGTEFIGSSKDNAPAFDVPFVASTDDTALLEISGGIMRVRVDDKLIERVSVGTSIVTPNLNSASGWTDASTNGGAVSHGPSGATLNAVNLGGLARIRQTVIVAPTDAGKRHAINITVSRGPVTLRCGSSVDDDDYIAETSLRAGFHSLAITPTGNFTISFHSDRDVDRIVKSCAIAPPGVMEIEAPWLESDLSYIRYDQSADVIFVACDGYQPHRIERRAKDSWSIVIYSPQNGPFQSSRAARITLKPSVNSGNGTLTSDLAFFKPGHVGALFRLFHTGRNQSWRLSDEGFFTGAWRVNGIGSDNDFIISRSGTWTGTLTIQRSFDGPDSGFIDVDIFTANGTETRAPGSGLDNIIAWYRIGFKPGNYTSGAAVVSVNYRGDGGWGVCRVTGVVSSTVASIEVVRPFYGTDPSDNWQEGVWSERQGWPTCVAFHRGRLWWPGKTRVIGSVSDDFENFDPEIQGDSGYVSRSLGSGPVDQINFCVSLSRLIVGTSGAEVSVKSTSLDEPITPQNVQASDLSTQGSRKGVGVAKIDSRAVFVQRSGKRLFELVFNPDVYEYSPKDLMLLAPDLTGNAYISGIAVQRQPDTRIHVWLSDGTALVLTYEPIEEVVCWSRVDMIDNGGAIEHVSILPGEDEDRVYYRVRRVNDGNTVRYLERFSLMSECKGGAINKLADSSVTLTGVTSAVIGGLDHLEGHDVVVWADGRDAGVKTVVDGAIALDAVPANGIVTVGLGYTARYKSTKLAYAAAAGTALTQKKNVNYLGVILGVCHNDGLYFGRSFEKLDPLPRRLDGRDVGRDEVFSEYDQPATSFPGEWSTDARLFLRAKAPRPCELMAAIVSVETHDKA